MRLDVLLRRQHPLPPNSRRQIEIRTAYREVQLAAHVKQRKDHRIGFDSESGSSGTGSRSLVKQYTGAGGLTIRTYNRLGPDAPVSIAASHGEWTVVQKLFASRQTSPFDLNPSGRSLLAEASYGFQIHACQMLIQHGITPSERSCDKGSSATAALAWAAMEYETSREAIVRANGTMSSFAGYSTDPFIDEDGRLLRGFLEYPPHLLARVIRLVYPNYELLDPLLQTRMAFGGQKFDTERVKLLLGRCMTLLQAFEVASLFGLKANHITLRSKISWTLAHCSEMGEYPPEIIKCLSDIVKFERRANKTHTYRSTVSAFPDTCFRFKGPQSHSNFERMCNKLVTQAARRWMKLLHTAGAHFEHYLAAKKMAIAHLRNRSITFHDRHGRLVIFRLQSICGDVKVDGWKFFVVLGSIQCLHDIDGRGWVETVEGYNEYEMSGALWKWMKKPEFVNIPGPFNDKENNEELLYSSVIVQRPIL